MKNLWDTQQACFSCSEKNSEIPRKRLLSIAKSLQTPSQKHVLLRLCFFFSSPLRTPETPEVSPLASRASWPSTCGETAGRRPKPRGPPPWATKRRRRAAVGEGPTRVVGRRGWWLFLAKFFFFFGGYCFDHWFRKWGFLIIHVISFLVDFSKGTDEYVGAVGRWTGNEWGDLEA